MQKKASYPFTYFKILKISEVCMNCQYLKFKKQLDLQIPYYVLVIFTIYNIVYVKYQNPFPSVSMIFSIRNIVYVRHQVHLSVSDLLYWQHGLCETPKSFPLVSMIFSIINIVYVRYQTHLMSMIFSICTIDYVRHLHIFLLKEGNLESPNIISGYCQLQPLILCY